MVIFEVSTFSFIIALSLLFIFYILVSLPSDFLIDSNVNWNPDGTFRHTLCFIRDDTARKIKEAVDEYEKNHFIYTAKAKDAFIMRIFHGKINAIIIISTNRIYVLTN